MWYDFTDKRISALFCVYFICSAINLVPTAEEKEERRAAIELHKVEKLQPGGMTKEELREYNRQLFLNLPKTPATPFNPMSPTTPRTHAFTRLNGGERPTAPLGNAGPSRKLPFREQYAEGVER